LWAFNEEEVARAVFSCRTPVISAVGHETDVTITDFVADLRAPTPSAAAELAVFDQEQFRSDLDGISEGLTYRMKGIFDRKSAMLENLSLKLEKKSPLLQLQNKRQMLDADTDRMRELLNTRLQFEKYRLRLAAEQLNGLSPLNKLESGFAYVSDSKNRNVKSTQGVRPGDHLNIVVTDGAIKAEVLEVTDGEKHDHRRGV
jgi:exodeoxyribonuclease VII large subunit